MTCKKLRGEEGRGGGRWDKQVTSSHKCPFLYTVARTQIFTCKSQFSIHIQPEFQKWLPLTTVDLRAFSTAHKPSTTSTSLTEGHDKRRGGKKHNTVKAKGLRRFQEDQNTMYFCVSFTHHTDSFASQAVQAISTTYVHTIKRIAWESWGQWQSNGEGWPFFHRGEKTKH